MPRVGNGQGFDGTGIPSKDGLTSNTDAKPETPGAPYSKPTGTTGPQLESGGNRQAPVGSK